MARKPRIQYPGAIYHILSRGNYCKDLFTVAQTGLQFEKALFEACQSCGWRLQAQYDIREAKREYGQRIAEEVAPYLE